MTDTLNYLKILIATHSIRRLGTQAEKTAMDNIKKELDSLNELLLRGYWSMFASTWPRVRITLHNEADDIFRGVFAPSIRNTWGYFIRASALQERLEEYRKKLGWLIHFAFARKGMLEEFYKSVLETHLLPAYKKNISLEEISHPDIILDMILTDPLDETRVEELSFIISYIFTINVNNLHHFMHTFVEKLSDTVELGFDYHKTGSVLRRYILEIVDNTEAQNFWNHVSAGDVKEILERVTEESDRTEIYRSFLTTTRDISIIESIDHDIIAELLHDPTTMNRLVVRIQEPTDTHDMRDQVERKLTSQGITLQ